MAAAAAPISLAATGLSAFGKISAGDTASANAITQGRATATADQFRAQQLSNDAEYGEVKATQTSAIMQQQLASKLAQMSVVNAARNVAPGGSADALANRETAVSDQDRQQRVGNIEAQVVEDRQDSGFYAQAGANALAQSQANASNDSLTGWLGGIASGLSGLAGLKGGDWSTNTSLPNNRNGGLLGFG